MLSFIAKRRTKAQKFKSSIRLVSEPEDITNSHHQTLDIFDINEKPRQTPPVPSSLEGLATEVEDEPEADQSSASAYSEQQEDVSPALLSTISPRVEVSISEEPLNDWFPRHLLKSSGSNELELGIAIKRRDTHGAARDENINSSEVRFLLTHSVVLSLYFPPMLTTLQMTASTTGKKEHPKLKMLDADAPHQVISTQGPSSPANTNQDTKS